MKYVLDIESNTDMKTIRICGLYCIDTGEYEFDMPTTVESTFNRIFKEGDVVYTWNGARFDLPVINKGAFDIEKFFKKRGVRHVDLMIVSKMLFPDIGSHALAAWGKRLWPSRPDLWAHKPENIDWYDTAPLPELITYLKSDLMLTAMLVDHFRAEMAKSSGHWLHAIKVEHKVAELTNLQVDKMMAFDCNTCIKLVNEMVTRYIEIETESKRFLPTLPIPKSKQHQPPSKQFLINGDPSKAIISYAEKYKYALHLSSDGWSVTDGSKYHKLPLTEPLVQRSQLSLTDQTGLKEWLITQGWRPTAYNSVKDKLTGKPRQTSPRLTDAVTKEPCPSLLKMGITWIPLVSEWLMLRARIGILKGLHKQATANGGYIASDGDTIGTNTARWRHKGIVNIPRVSSPYGKEIRGLFRARLGSILVGWDASSLEACMEAHYTFPYDPAYAKSLVEGNQLDGTDVHSINWHKLGLESRDQAKTFKYAITYGAQPKKIAEQMGWPLARAQQVYDDFWATNPALAKLKADLEAEWKRYGKTHIVGLDGRLIATRSQHSLINAKFQSAGAIVMKHSELIAHATIHDRFKLSVHKDDVYGLVRYHDEEIWECKAHQASEVALLGIDSITKAGKFFKLNVPLKGDAKTGYSWAEIH